MREAELAASLDHPHVVPILSFGEEDGRLYLAMAYVEGYDLRELLRRDGPLEPARTLNLIAQVAEALDAAHAADLVHRDIKPANILVSTVADGEHAFVCDFGLARHVSSVSSLTGDRGFVGTLDYVPPEQIAVGPVDGRADVYSLGCVLYECLTGERPFERESELALVYAHLNDPPPRRHRPEARAPGGARRRHCDRAREGGRGAVRELRRARCGRSGRARRQAVRPPLAPSPASGRRDRRAARRGGRRDRRVRNDSRRDLAAGRAGDHPDVHRRRRARAGRRRSTSSTSAATSNSC